MKIEVSIGEAIDKLSILELKMIKISDKEKLNEIQKEINVLKDCFIYKTKYEFYYNLLIYVNEKIWDMTDIIKKLQVDNLQFTILSNEIFEFNQKRYRIKNWFNLITNSNIKEQKSYTHSHCRIIINNEQTIYHKISEINSLSLDYDIITFDTSYLSIIKEIFISPSFLYDKNLINNLPNPNIICLDNFISSEIVNKDIFMFSPIIYISSGFLGDFIQTLSVINENFYKTGRKGLLYITGDFRNGLENTYKDTYSIIKKQNYIKDYKLYNNETYDIDLRKWRKNNNLYKVNWYNLFKEIYNVEWGKHIWLDVPCNEKWNDIILINTTDYRWCYNIDFKILNNMFLDKLVFIGSEKKQYDYFKFNTGLNIRFYKFINFDDLCIAIKSCKLFVGSLSAPLTIAHAFHKNRIIGMTKCSEENKMNSDFNIIWNNVRYKV